MGSKGIVASTAALAVLAIWHRVSVCVENPRPFRGHVSIFDRPEFQALPDILGVVTIDFDQCINATIPIIKAAMKRA